MIDYFALALTHALIVLALVRIVARDELDRENPLVDNIAEPDQPAKREGARPKNRRKGAGNA
ncbi:hypothetical protein [Qipengyuania qiaonensis]|uniref:Uncharacterized protein n=1 Tax=Qipengyuania qiaonensis TaxID=2867240 RepID=A0ABS7J739_9SPHN|nr:hypothetical protein [Qipengyuania qiaonensis]MBX7481800.1 hypothetical protein [Qipengyuania qiaonensis]